MAEFASPVSPVLFLFCFFYLEGVEKHLIVHLDQPGDSRHLCVRHCIENDVVDTEERHQHQCGLQQFSVITKKKKNYNYNTFLYLSQNVYAQKQNR